MYERFTDHARKILKSASEEADRLQHHEMGAEHLLLGLLQETDGAAVAVLKNLNIDAAKVRRELNSVLQGGVAPTAAGNRSEADERASVIESAIEEARSMNHNYVGTEHLLLGVLSASDSAAARILRGAGLSDEAVRREVRKLIGEGFDG
jgi:ATP-dependent Clp protease ATP-binding subunit ClpC